jgi:hypothetical protein
VPDAVRAGTRLRRRRRIEAAAGSVAAVALIAALVPAAAGVFGSAAPPAPSAGRAGSQIAFVLTGTHTVTPVRLSTGQVLTPVKVPGGIQDIVASPDGNGVYVFSTGLTSRNSALVSYVTKINSATARAGRPVRLTGNGRVSAIYPVQIAPNGKLAYATELGAWPSDAKDTRYALVAINLATGVQRNLVNAGNGFGWVMSPDGQTAYDRLAAGEVPVVDLATGTQLPPIKLRAPGIAYSLAFAPDGRTLYAASASASARLGGPSVSMWLTPIRTAANAAAKPIEVQQTGYEPQITVAPDGKTGYVSGGRYLSPVNLAVGTALKAIRLPAEFAHLPSVFGISSNSEFGYEYLPRPDPVQLIINLRSGSVLKPVALPGGYSQSEPAFPAGGSTIYVPAAVNRGALPAQGALFPVQAATGQIGKPILFSGVPNGIVLAG